MARGVAESAMTGVPLSRAALLLLNCIPDGRYPLALLFESERRFTRYFYRLPWHGLSPTECLHELGCLAGLGLVEIDWSTTGPGCGSSCRGIGDREPYIALTPAGGACWEQAFAVDWRKAIFDSAESVPEDVAHRTRVQFASIDTLNEWKTRLSASEFRENYRFHATRELESWCWSGWKTLAGAAEVLVDIVWVDGAYFDAVDFMIRCNWDLRAGFRARDAPTDFVWDARSLHGASLSLPRD